MGDHAGQDEREAKDRSEPSRQQGERDKTAKERREESDQDSVSGEGEDQRDVESRLCSGDNLFGDALEGRDKLTQDGAHTVEDDRDTNPELQRLRKCGHDVGTGIRRAEDVERLLQRQSDEAPDSEHQVDENHRNCGGDHRVAQELQPLREVDLLRRVALLAGCLTGSTSSNVAEGPEVADRDCVITGDLLCPGVSEGRHHDHDHTEQQRTDQHDEPVEIRAKTDREHNAQQQRHEHHVVTRQEHVLERREPSKHEHHDKAEGEYIGAGRTILNRGECRNDLVGGDDTLSSSHPQDKVSEWSQRANHNASAGTKDQET